MIDFLYSLSDRLLAYDAERRANPERYRWFKGRDGYDYLTNPMSESRRRLLRGLGDAVRVRKTEKISLVETPKDRGKIRARQTGPETTPKTEKD